jgi:condensation domain-containing protein
MKPGRRAGQEAHRLTSQQARAWVSSRLNGGLAQRVYVCDTPPGISLASLVTAVRTLADRHTALRTRISREDGCLLQRADGPPPILETWETGGMTADEATAGLWEPGTMLVNSSEGPVARFIALTGTGGIHGLVVVLHAAIADGWSRVIILRELDLLVSGRAATDRALRPVCALAELAARERDRRAGPDHTKRIRFWERLLAGLEPCPIRRPAEPARRSPMRHIRTLDAPAGQGVRYRCAEARVSPSAGYLAALAAVAGRVMDTGVLPVCLLTSGRDAHIGSSIGVFANHVVMPVSAGTACVTDIAGMWRDIVLALRNEVPLPDLLEYCPWMRGPVSAMTLAGIGFQMAPQWPAFGVLNFRPAMPPNAYARPFSAIEISVRQGPGRVQIEALWDSSRCPEELALLLLDGMTSRLQRYGTGRGVRLLSAASAVSAQPQPTISTQNSGRPAQ